MGIWSVVGQIPGHPDPPSAALHRCAPSILLLHAQIPPPGSPLKMKCMPGVNSFIIDSACQTGMCGGGFGPGYLQEDRHTPKGWQITR
eukprot:1160605-Pelagomonas_calceolata.AAC.1